MLELGVRDVRNQGVPMCGVNNSAEALLDFCFAFLNEAGVMSYYFYLCDVIPNSERWRLPLWHAQELQEAIMGYLPGFANPRIVCDVHFVGKRWVHQVEKYDRERGSSYCGKNYVTIPGADDPSTLRRIYNYCDPINSLPSDGQVWWRTHAPVQLPVAASKV